MSCLATLHFCGDHPCDGCIPDSLVSSPRSLAQGNSVRAWDGSYDIGKGERGHEAAQAAYRALVAPTGGDAPSMQPGGAGFQGGEVDSDHEPVGSQMNEAEAKVAAPVYRSPASQRERHPQLDEMLHDSSMGGLKRRKVSGAALGASNGGGGSAVNKRPKGRPEVGS